jgi:hypothetical protein
VGALSPLSEEQPAASNKHAQAAAIGGIRTPPAGRRVFDVPRDRIWVRFISF